MSNRVFGLSRPDIESTLSMFNVSQPKKRAILNQLVEMESAALEVLNRK